MEYFIHPWYMAAGGALVSSPILIHLINRMRFKRIRWAAMEFLLKSQKRNRRRLIIEQMILLLLRILLVLLAAFLVARFLFAGTGTKGATHLVVVDDTLSMGDKGRDTGKEQTAFGLAKEQVVQLARSAAQAPSAQFMQVYLLSDLEGTPLFNDRLSDRSVNALDTAFVARADRPSMLHASPLEALKKAQAFFADVKEGQRVLHFVSDFRRKDWGEGGDAEKLQEELRRVVESGVHVNLVDVAGPARAKGARVALHHDNLAIVDFQPEARVVVEDAAVEFKVKVRNYGTGEAGSFMRVYVNGQEDLSRSQVLEKVKPGEPPQGGVDHKFTLTFPRRNKPGSDITEKDGPEERERKRRMDREFFHVRVALNPEQAGLNADNVRDLVIEVRRKVPTLVVDGNRPEARGDGSDIFHLSAFFAASAIYDLEERRLADLEKADLDLYPSIILLNVPEITDDKIIAKLKRYVEQGGALCYFLGDEVKSDNYNTKLYQAGIFPLLIGERPYDPLAAPGGLTNEDERKKERVRKRQVDPTPKIIFPEPDHPLVARLYPFRSVFRYLGVDLYWQAQPRSRWDPDGKQTRTPVVLPNTASVDRYKDRATGLMNQALEATQKLAEKEEEVKRYVGPVDAYRRKVRDALGSGELYRLAEVLEGVLKDPGASDDPERPAMEGLWKHASMNNLGKEIEEFRKTVLFGDPLVVSRPAGKGRVVAVLTCAGTNPRKAPGAEEPVQWNNWGAGEKLVSQTYPVFLLDLQRFLISEGQAPNRLVGEKVEAQFDATRYEPKYTWTFDPQPDLEVERPRAPKEAQKPNTGQMSKSGGLLNFSLADVRQPGVYRLEFTLVGEGPAETRKEVRAYSFNVDAESESPLARADRDRLSFEVPRKDPRTATLNLMVAGTDSFDVFKERQPDASESPWLYLFFILILVVEQAMAVHLSFHLKGSEAAPAAPPGRAAPAAAA